MFGDHIFQNKYFTLFKDFLHWRMLPNCRTNLGCEVLTHRYAEFLSELICLSGD